MINLSGIEVTLPLKIVIFSCIPFFSWSSSFPPFIAECIEDTTFRYDGGNGLDMRGREIELPGFGWMTEKWGGLTVKWSGGEGIKVGELDMAVLLVREWGVAAGVVNEVTGSSASELLGVKQSGVSLYSFAIDISLGEAVFSQSTISRLGMSKQIKVRSQNLKCDVKFYTGN